MIKNLTRICLIAGKDYFHFICYIDIRKIRKVQHMNRLFLQTKQLCKTFSSDGQQQHVLCNLDIDIYEGDFTIIMGSSGSGKTTLLYALSGMDTPTLGKIIFQGTEIQDFNSDELANFRKKHCGFVFQNIYLLENMSILDNVLTAGYLVNNDKPGIIKRAKELFLQVGLTEEIWSKFPSQLSGGERQRAALIRSIINEPDILFADEPTGALNSSSGKDVLDILTKVNQKGQSIVMVTHDIKAAIRADRIIYLMDGKVCGELHLDKYSEADMEERSKKARDFLQENNW
jgi:putative ABC transport system ATP-binding protein